MPAILAPIVEWICAIAWPAIVRLATWLGLGSLPKLIWQWIALLIGEKAVQSLVGTLSVLVLLQIWAAFLFVFWNFTSLSLLRQMFSTSPFDGVSSMGGALYLASNFFPFSFFFGCAIAYIQWRLTLVHAAIILNRLVRIMQGM